LNGLSRKVKLEKKNVFVIPGSQVAERDLSRTANVPDAGRRRSFAALGMTYLPHLVIASGKISKILKEK